MSGVHPFNEDVRNHGQFLYTGGIAPTSARLATARQSRLLYDALDAVNAGRILDFGCGDGFFTAEIARRYEAQVVGYDPSTEAVRAARVNYSDVPNIRFVDNLADLGSDYTAGFDAVVLRGVVHHAKDPEATITSAAQFSRVIFVMEPNGLNPGMKAIERFSEYHRSHGERSFTPWTINSWLRKAGFRRIHLTVGVLVPYFCPRGLARFLARLQPVVERIPVVRWVACGTQLHVGRLT